MAEEEKGFVIKDKRVFSPDAEEPSPETSQATEEKRAQKNEEAPKADQEPPQSENFQLPEVNFATFVFSLSSSALLHFGEVADPSTGVMNKNLPMAKHTIDILGLLEEKTRGNLTDDESQLLKNILYDLRMRFVKENA